MKMYTSKELLDLPKFDSISKAQEQPNDVIVLSLQDISDPELLLPILDFPNVQSLTLRNCDVSAVENQFSRFLQLQQLQFFKTSPVSLTDFHPNHLRILTIAVSPLELSALESISKMATLEHLRLIRNAIKEIPFSLQRLQSLVNLVFKNQKLQGFPASLLDLCKLESLSMRGNNLEEIPDEIDRLINLTGLDFFDNQIRTLPESISRLSRLHSISLGKNPLDSIPRFLSLMPNLNHVGAEADLLEQLQNRPYPHSKKTPLMDVADMQLTITPESEFYSQVRSNIQHDNLEALEDVILLNSREAIAIKTTVPEDYATPGGSRFGGFPDLEGREHFPKKHNKYASFMAQINLAEIADYQTYLPRKGLLSFFVVDLEVATVIYYAGDLGRLKNIRHKPDEAEDEFSEVYTQNPYKVKFGKTYAPPRYLPEQKLENENDRKARDNYGMGKLFGDVLDGLEHTINGYFIKPWVIDNSKPKFAGEVQDWVPLLNLGFEQSIGFCFNDAGTLSFLIHIEDLRRWDFSHIRVTIGSS